MSQRAVLPTTPPVAKRPVGTAAEAFADLEAHAALVNLSEFLPDSEKFAHLVRVLVDHAARTNLIGDPTPHGVADHVLEAMCLAQCARLALQKVPLRIVDVGAGAGLEAWTLAAIWPEAQVIAVEPRGLRHAFVSTLVAETGLNNMEVLGKSLHAAELPANFDLATARAVWPPAEWLAKARLLLATGGVVGVHGSGAAPVFAKFLRGLGWDVPAARDVPGERGHAVAVAAPRL